MLVLSAVVIALLASSNFGTSLVAVRMSKDTKAAPTGELTTIGGEVMKTATASVKFPLSAAPAMTIERLATVSDIAVSFFVSPGRVPPFMDGYTVSGYKQIQKSYQVVAVTKLSPTAVLFATSEQGQAVLVADGLANLTVRALDGALLWSRAVCPDKLGCSAITVDSAEEAASLVEAAATAVRRKLESRQVSHAGHATAHVCEDPSVDDAEAYQCECMDEISDHCNEAETEFEACVLEAFCNFPWVCSQWKEINCPGIARRLGQLSFDENEDEDAFEHMEAFLQEASSPRARRLGKCSQ